MEGGIFYLRNSAGYIRTNKHTDNTVSKQVEKKVFF